MFDKFLELALLVFQAPKRLRSIFVECRGSRRSHAIAIFCVLRGALKRGTEPRSATGHDSDRAAVSMNCCTPHNEHQNRNARSDKEDHHNRPEKHPRHRPVFA